MSQSLEHNGSQGNELFPVFLKLNQLTVLLIGAGNVGYEKLQALLINSPSVNVRVVSLEVSAKVEQLSSKYANVEIYKKEYAPSDLDGVHLVIAATANPLTNDFICQSAHERNLLVNVADKPDLCDFYLASIAKKGSLKIAISTNGKSPTMAKRLRDVLQGYLPEEIEDTLEQLNRLRDTLKGDFADKVKQLNAITAILSEQGRNKE
ncbi:precorrin-2 dehydrogenase/sirohydrochlorin ferrochelatase family protein [Olivibacter sitiensis]|uniref:precorrin-2 dehydrogenase/sirohydrochlorin ferrochelatase family protein n=1 Tax=Olivibacter sitiensis TaxID=376470 RepID=UPI000400BA7B|nr:bifunctional precorrin-2 dehydrogenase/sirohydrochlorin ferrochelatase [Olivibacter sitiensis]